MRRAPRGLLVPCFALAGAACSFAPGAFAPDATSSSVSVGFVEATTLTDETVGTIEIAVGLSGEPEAPVMVGYRLAGGTATLAADFTFTPGTLTFTTADPQTFPITILADGEAEPDETIELELHMISGATPGQRTHTVTISSNALPRIHFAMPSSQVVEADTTVMVEVTLDTSPAVPVTVTYEIVATSTATSGEDYTLAIAPITFAVAETTKLIAIDVHDDLLDEFDEDVTLRLLGATAAIIGTGDTHALTIVDDGDPAPEVYFATASHAAKEMDQTVDLEVRLTIPSGKPITVPFSRANASTATVPDDYTYATASPLSFAPGTVGPQTITITIVDDTIDEPDETAITVLGTPTNATLSTTLPVTHTLTILDDDVVCFGPAGTNAEICYDRGPTSAVTLPATLDTVTSELCATEQPIDWIEVHGQPEACFVLGTAIAVGTTRVTGSRPLVLVATTALSVTGHLNASSERVSGATGPASPSAGCQNFPSAPDNSGSGAGGGAGASFLSKGGNGGTGNNGNSDRGTSPNADATPPAILRAGCHGQRGGNGGMGGGTQSGAAGRGGGVIYLVSGGTISLGGSAVLNVSGSGASGSNNAYTGGSGGGSGGTIRLHAPVISTQNGTKIAANGGGGSAGGDNSTGGGPGADWNPGNNVTSQAAGGNGPGGNGGNGFAGSSQAGNGQNGGGNRGGGGGGGGGGYVRANVSLGSAGVSAGMIVIAP
jgi:hypothetical protein